MQGMGGGWQRPWKESSCSDDEVLATGAAWSPCTLVAQHVVLATECSTGGAGLWPDCRCACQVWTPSTAARRGAHPPLPPGCPQETEEIVADVLGVEVFRQSIAGNVLVGSYCKFTNQGGLVAPQVGGRPGGAASAGTCVGESGGRRSGEAAAAPPPHAREQRMHGWGEVCSPRVPACCALPP